MNEFTNTTIEFQKAQMLHHLWQNRTYRDADGKYILNPLHLSIARELNKLSIAELEHLERGLNAGAIGPALDWDTCIVAYLTKGNYTEASSRRFDDLEALYIRANTLDPQRHILGPNQIKFLSILQDEVWAELHLIYRDYDDDWGQYSSD